MMGHLNSFLARGGGNLNKNFPKIQMPGGCPGGMLKLDLTGTLYLKFVGASTKADEKSSSEKN